MEIEISTCNTSVDSSEQTLFGEHSHETDFLNITSCFLRAKNITFFFLLFFRMQALFLCKKHSCFPAHPSSQGVGRKKCNILNQTMYVCAPIIYDKRAYIDNVLNSWTIISFILFPNEATMCLFCIMPLTSLLSKARRNFENYLLNLTYLL